MKIGIAGPVSLKMLSSLVNKGEEMPEGYLMPSMALWIKELLLRGHQVSVFTLATQIDESKHFEGKNLQIHIGKYRSQKRARDFFKQERCELLAAMQKDVVDILHAHWTYEFALAALETNYPTLITARDAPLNILKNSPDPYRLIRFLMAWQVCHKAPALTAVSPYIKQHFKKVFGYKREIIVIPNGISESIFKLFDLTNRTIHHNKIIFASNLTGWSKGKNGQILLKAFDQVRKINPDVELWMYGWDHGKGEKAQIWAQVNGLTQNVVFRGQTPYQQLLKELSENVDVLVHPSLEESFSMAIAEAMALGIPVIGGKYSGAVADTLGDGGLLVNVRSEKKLATEMLKLAINKELRLDLGHNGRLLAIEKYNLKSVVGQYQNIYNNLIDKWHLK